MSALLWGNDVHTDTYVTETPITHHRAYTLRKVIRSTQHGHAQVYREAPVCNGVPKPPAGLCTCTARDTITMPDADCPRPWGRMWA